MKSAWGKSVDRQRFQIDRVLPRTNCINCGSKYKIKIVWYIFSCKNVYEFQGGYSKVQNSQWGHFMKHTGDKLDSDTAAILPSQLLSDHSDKNIRLTQQ